MSLCQAFHTSSFEMSNALPDDFCCFMRPLLDGRLRVRWALQPARSPAPLAPSPVDRTNDSHERPGPFAPLPLQEIPHYYEPVRQRALQRYSCPRAWSLSPHARHSLSPPAGRQRFQNTPSHVPHESRRQGSRHLHTGHRLASQRAHAKLIPEFTPHSGFDVVFKSFDASTVIVFPAPT